MIQRGDDDLVANLNEVPELLVEQARALGSFHEARSLLSARTTGDNTPYLTSFVREVVFGKEAAPNWRRSRTLVPDIGLAILLTARRDSLLGCIGGGFSKRVRPNREDWMAGVGSTGAPALPEPNADYRSKLPQGTIGLKKAVLDAGA